MPAPSSNSYVTVTVNTLSSAGAQLTAQTIRPTAALPQARPETKIAHGLVVVAVDENAGSTEALRWAFDEAVMRGGELEVIQAIRPDASATETSSQQSRLSELLADWRSDFPSLAVRIDVTRGDPAPLLVEASADAAVVVARPVTGHSHVQHPDEVLLAV